MLCSADSVKIVTSKFKRNTKISPAKNINKMDLQLQEQKTKTTIKEGKGPFRKHLAYGRGGHFIKILVPRFSTRKNIDSMCHKHFQQLFFNRQNRIFTIIWASAHSNVQALLLAQLKFLQGLMDSD